MSCHILIPIPHIIIPMHRFLVRVSYLELYNEEVCDLLNKTVKKKLEIHVRPDIGAYVKDLSCFVVKNADEMEKLMTIGNKNSKICLPCHLSPLSLISPFPHSPLSPNLSLSFS